MQVVPTMMRSRNAEGAPAGWSSPDDWRSMTAALAKERRLPPSPTVEELVTNRFMETNVPRERGGGIYWA